MCAHEQHGRQLGQGAVCGSCDVCRFQGKDRFPDAYGQSGKWTDADVEELIKAYISESVQVEEESAASEKRKTYAGVGDYFSQEDYDKVRKSDDNVFSRYAAKARQEKPEKETASTDDLGFYTETLAQIYAEQGYFEQAKRIYSKLILAYPEKSAYFATLIQKMNELN